jgi:hypothetical protein
MKKLLIGLLVVAAGTGIFFFACKQKDKPVTQELKKEMIIGQWTTQSTPGNDSSFNQYRYEFQKEGQLVKSLNDSVKADTAHYEWNKDNELVWKENATDSAGKNFTVLKLTADSLQVQGKDSVTILFTKLK